MMIRFALPFPSGARDLPGMKRTSVFTKPAGKNSLAHALTALREAPRSRTRRQSTTHTLQLIRREEVLPRGGWKLSQYLLTLSQLLLDRPMTIFWLDTWRRLRM
jgi:hypothetical protein